MTANLNTLTKSGWPAIAVAVCLLIMSDQVTFEEGMDFMKVALAGMALVAVMEVLKWHNSSRRKRR